jgi:hypothetical protein
MSGKRATLCSLDLSAFGSYSYDSSPDSCAIQFLLPRGPLIELGSARRGIHVNMPPWAYGVNVAVSPMARPAVLPCLKRPGGCAMAPERETPAVVSGVSGWYDLCAVDSAIFCYEAP